MTTKRSHNAAVISTQTLKKPKPKLPKYTRQLKILYPFLPFLAKCGLSAMKQVYMFTTWRRFFPHPYKDVICPLPPNKVIEAYNNSRPKKNAKIPHKKTKKQLQQYQDQRQ